LEDRIEITTEWLLRGISILAIIFALYLLIQHQFLVSTIGSISSVSLGSAGALFILSEYCFLSSGRMNRPDAIVFGILFPAAFLASYELIFHFSFTPAPHYNTLAVIGGGLRYLGTEGVLLLPIIFLRRNLAFTRVSAFLLALFAVMWFVWFLYGFPQYYTYAPIYYPPVLKTNDYWDTSLFFNFGSKTVLAFFFASILKMRYREEIRNLLWRLRIL
jgi:hypothetical protein